MFEDRDKGVLERMVFWVSAEFVITNGGEFKSHSRHHKI